VPEVDLDISDHSKIGVVVSCHRRGVRLSLVFAQGWYWHFATNWRML
jgi:hypothetical protein